ncbi:bifunctional 23S rRNA (guanine(2069)-N(7))-methyltransferase RlmK/23S rRNA (guanine(2445)-N(2))-methyltransferase RlmL [Marinagarivorans cellulosilyticus]|uniref:Ribosomal RNA large subunit methyltransferase K/L n=1 Tax=Marinagarivorans cellulosilyticus TaxID=2721545 RepID=A0AAN1WJX3_9GAMM|nr:bifunctional 23S rRNA (guanine(2069)-N(7))-methyltransferase RlmK/23S rRNA (guanine(2445)-N(2))-methyltransferase RlmL [Marinagarivorans cellulosilyticus]BCD98892.1 23S rRNA (guanine2445-N2)-methyltransferase / 23S rRNA (guanine2069-N7)-methyltransferase [Marinagarivorans cellulosilyticus]
MQFFVTCPKGFEDLLLEEMQSLGAEDCRQTIAGVACDGELDFAYKAVLNSRLANRVLWSVKKALVETADDLYAAAKAVEWKSICRPDASFAVDFSGSNRAINNTQFGALRVKDAVVDYWREAGFERPNVDKQSPDVRINVRLNRGEVTIALDFAGGSLHQRGYRQEQGAAPLKENLAAAILLRMGWPAVAANGGSLIDPMCGSGTFLTEAALMALDVPPGVYREHWAFGHLSVHQPALWERQYSVAKGQLAKAADTALPPIFGFDMHPPVLRAANNNIQRAGLQGKVIVGHNTLAQLRCDNGWPAGIIVTNPPYGERLGEVEALKGTYLQMAQVAKEYFAGWTLGVFTGNPELAQHMRMRASKKNKLFNGAIACELQQFKILAASEATLRKGEATEERPINLSLTDGAQMVANRLRKNVKALKPWLKKTGNECYRVYDADMPEYSAAIDIYAGEVHLQEYAAPKTIKPAAAKARFNEIHAAVCQVFEKAPDEIATKTRERNKGEKQYEKFALADNPDIKVMEGHAAFWVNLHKYIDTGLFLDHRPLRLKIASEVLGKSFLNLFCYTATASVHAALGGAKKTVSVDMSKTYLAWAKRNFDLNHIGEENHLLVQSDVSKYLAGCREGFDVIMLDPPSFSNSKRMDDVLDIQRDHVALIKRCMDVLLPTGTLYFSNNLRTFKLDADELVRFNIEDITAQSIDVDFSRNTKIHQCFAITHKR